MESNITYLCMQDFILDTLSSLLLRLYSLSDGSDLSVDRNEEPQEECSSSAVEKVTKDNSNNAVNEGRLELNVSDAEDPSSMAATNSAVEQQATCTCSSSFKLYCPLNTDATELSQEVGDHSLNLVRTSTRNEKSLYQDNAELPRDLQRDEGYSLDTSNDNRVCNDKKKAVDRSRAEPGIDDM